MRSIDKVNAHSILPRMKDSIIKGHGAKVRVDGFKRDLIGTFFTLGGVCIWNRLPGDVIEADVITSFKSNLKNIWIGKAQWDKD